MQRTGDRVLKVFISHASEDKEALVRPLAQALRSTDLQVWYDEYELTVGDSLRNEIDKGLAQCDFAVLVLSSRFFEKTWPQIELDALVAKEASARRKMLLPIWHGIDAKCVMRYSPILASKLAAKSSDGIQSLVLQIRKAIGTGAEPVMASGARISLVELHEEMREHLDSLRYSLTTRYKNDVTSGALAPAEWPEPKNAESWFVEHQLRLPKVAREGFKAILLNYQARLNGHLDFLRTIMASGQAKIGDTTVEVEHLRRLHALIDQFDEEANGMREVSWLKS